MIIHQLTALKDNYIYILHGGGETAVVDPSLDHTVLEFLELQGWKLDYILNTHHHWDHTDGNIGLKKVTGATIMGYEGDAKRIPKIDIELKDSEVIRICGESMKATYTPGHTIGHVAYYFEGTKSLFCGDTLFSMGCGRLFEGTAQQMFDSLQKIKALPLDTKIYCGHEYTESNGRFAQAIFPGNTAIAARIAEVKGLREKGQPTIPVLLSTELETNPFLLAKNVEEFAGFRKMKDSF